MRRAISTGLFLLLLLLAAGLLGAQQSPYPEPSPADAEQLRQVVEEHRVETSTPSPGITLYLSDAMIAILFRIGEFIDRFMPELGVFNTAITWVGARLIILLAGLVLLLVLVQILRRWWRHHRLHDEPETPFRELPRTGSVAGRSREDWAEELRRQLERRDVAAALAALWWWLACALLPSEVDPAWTSRELISRAGRPDLRSPVRRLDRMIYGADPPTVDDLRRFWHELGEALR